MEMLVKRYPGAGCSGGDYTQGEGATEGQAAAGHHLPCTRTGSRRKHPRVTTRGPCSDHHKMPGVPSKLGWHCDHEMYINICTNKPIVVIVLLDFGAFNEKSVCIASYKYKCMLSLQSMKSLTEFIHLLLKFTTYG